MVENTLCIERHKAIDEKLDAHGRRIGVHGDRLDKLENSQTRTEVVVQNLCDQIKALVEAMQAQQVEQRQQQKEQTTRILGIASTTIVILLGFLIWYIQTIPR